MNTYAQFVKSVSQLNRVNTCFSHVQPGCRESNAWCEQSRLRVELWRAPKSFCRPNKSSRQRISFSTESINRCREALVRTVQRTHTTQLADPNHEIRNQTSRQSIEHTGAIALAAVGTTCPLSAALSAGPLGSGSMGFLISRRLTVSSSRDQRLRTISRPRVIPAVSYPRRWHK